MDQQSMPSSQPSSPAASSSASSQPETQGPSSPMMTQPPLSLATQPLTQHSVDHSLAFTQMTDNPSGASYQLLATQPSTQVDYHPQLEAGASYNDIDSQCASQLGADDNDSNDQSLSQIITQPATQPCNYSINDTANTARYNGEGGGEQAVPIMGPGTSQSNDAIEHGCVREKGYGIVGEVAGFDYDDNDDEACFPPNATTSLNSINSRAMPTETRKDAANAVNTDGISQHEANEQSTHQQLASEVLGQQTTNKLSNAEADTMDTSHSSTMPRQGVALVTINDTTERNDTIDKINYTCTAAAAPLQRKPVTNPYAKNKKAESAKRPIDQISQGSSSGSVATAGDSSKTIQQKPNELMNPNNVTFRKQVFNPYAKPKQTPKQAIRNPYAKAKTCAATPSIQPLATKNAAPLPTMKIANADPTAMERKETPKEATATIVNQPTLRRTGISISLPMAERLPSRNVSYQPAEILTVGELYRYLYHTNIEKQQQSSATQNILESDARSGSKEDSAPTFKELVSVRITGTLLCVATSNPDGAGGLAENLYNSGTYLLVGDPLENTRFLKKERAAKQNEGNATSATNATTPSVFKATPKAGLTSILRNKKTPVSLPSMSGAKTPSSKPPTALNSTDSTVMADQKEPPMANTTNSSRNKPLNRGILNTNKKKRLVYNGGGGKRLSFGGGGGMAGKVGGSLLGRKFVTPKRRLDSTGPLSSVKKDFMNRASLSSSVKKSALASVKTIGSHGGVYSRKNTKPEYVIQRHPSPIVPIWIGSFYNGDGLDGSVVGDLVMIMGEIVVEHCPSCQQTNNKDDHCDSKRKGEDTDVSLTDMDSADSNKEEDTYQQQAEKSFAAPTQLHGVRDAAHSIAASARKVDQSQAPSNNSRSRAFCSQCTRFLRARIVKNANGTDMSLQREALRARRTYLAERKLQMECLMSASAMTNHCLYSVGCIPRI